VKRSVTGTIVKLLIASLLVGLALSIVDVSPEEILRGLGGRVQRIFSVFVRTVQWAVPSALLGAVIVVPLWAVNKLWRLLRGRTAKS
jgi:Na+/H+-dicarboxylate symporter